MKHWRCFRGQRTRSSGAFSTLTPLASTLQSFFGVGTWNANGLFCVSDYIKMCRKIKLLVKQIKKSSIFCVQEAHGNSALLNKHFRKLLLDYWVFSSFVGQGSGGVLVFVSKKIVPNQEDITSEVLVAGRVMRITISDPSDPSKGQQVIYNIHNFGMDMLGMRHVTTKLGQDIDFAKNDPLSRSLFVLGDMNYSNREKFAFSQPEEVHGLQA